LGVLQVIRYAETHRWLTNWLLEMFKSDNALAACLSNQNKQNNANHANHAVLCDTLSAEAATAPSVQGHCLQG
jgi:hypothetical protein